MSEAFGAALGTYAEAIDHLRPALLESGRRAAARAGGSSALADAVKPDRGVVLRLLRSRDALESLLAKTDPASEDRPSDEQLLTLFALDQDLRRLGPRLHQLAPLEGWRDRLNPAPAAWWWWFEHPRDHYDWLWSGVTLVLLTISGSFALSITTRILASEVFWLGSLTLVAQSVLTLATASGTLTQAGRTVIEKILGKVGLGKQWWQEAKVGLAGGLTLLLWLMHSGLLPELSRQSLIQGKASLGLTSDRSNLSAARVYLDRAVALNPDNVESHYFLGLVYQEMQDLEKAKDQYQLALGNDFLDAYNALGFLYLKEDKLGPAYTFLWQGQNLVNRDPEADVLLRYALKKNLGWLWLKQKRYEEAEAALDEAIEHFASFQKSNPQQAKNTGGSAYCLQAQVMDSTQQADRAKTLWNQCLDWANPRYPEQEEMLHQASDRLTEAPKAPPSKTAAPNKPGKSP